MFQPVQSWFDHFFGTGGHSPFGGANMTAPEERHPMDSPHDIRRQSLLEAEAWWVRLDVRQISMAKLAEFNVWREDPANRRAWEKVMRDARARARTIR